MSQIQIKKSMFTRLTVLLLFMVMMVVGYAWSKNPVERIIKSEGYMVAFIDLSHQQEGYARWYAFDTGVSSHLGKYTAYTWGVNNFIEGVNTGHGIQVTANGDKIFYETLETPEGITSSILGGTGRFEGIESCGENIRVIDPDSQTFEFVDDNTAMMTYSFTETGCLKY